jgi:hypothetical protein
MRRLKIGYSVVFLLVNFSLFSCAAPKIGQCEKMISFVNQVASETKNITENKSEKDYISWLEAADKMENASQEISKLLIFDSQLKDYQKGFVTMYLDYANSTRDMVKARQNKSLKQAKLAQEKVKNASELEQKLGNNINNYCLN